MTEWQQKVGTKQEARVTITIHSYHPNGPIHAELFVEENKRWKPERNE